jgi:hypothetical protein
MYPTESLFLQDSLPGAITKAIISVDASAFTM